MRASIPLPLWLGLVGLRIWRLSGALNGLAWRPVLGDDRAVHGNVLQERR